MCPKSKGNDKQLRNKIIFWHPLLSRTMSEAIFMRIHNVCFDLTHDRLNELPHTIYSKILILILGMSDYVI